MKALKEIGAGKVIRFAIFSVLQAVYHLGVDLIFNFPQTRKLFLQILGSAVGKDSIIMNVKFFNWHIVNNYLIILRVRLFCNNFNFSFLSQFLISLSLFARWATYSGMKKVLTKLEGLLEAFPFSRMDEVLEKGVQKGEPFGPTHHRPDPGL